MHNWRGLEEIPADWGRSVVTIGVFDGVHRGHQTLLERAVAHGRRSGLPVVVVTFDPHPDSVVRARPHPAVLTGERHKAELLAEHGADAVCVLPFTREFSQLSAEEFVQTVLAEGLGAAAVVVGENFRFGHKAAGDLEALHVLGEKYDFRVEGVHLVADADTITSTLIRECIAAGRVAEAGTELGRPHRLEGVVVRGDRRGRELGFPTANLEVAPHAAIPADGVYAGRLRRTQQRGEPEGVWPAALSIGTNPTFDGQVRSVEAYALDRDDLDLYGEHMAIEFSARVRPTLRFESAEELVAEMHRDVARVRELLAGQEPAPRR